MSERMYRRNGYFRAPPQRGEGADLIFLPTDLLRYTSAVDAGLFATRHGFGKLEYVPAPVAPTEKFIPLEMC